MLTLERELHGVIGLPALGLHSKIRDDVVPAQREIDNVTAFLRSNIIIAGGAAYVIILPAGPDMLDVPDFRTDQNAILVHETDIEVDDGRLVQDAFQEIPGGDQQITA